MIFMVIIKIRDFENFGQVMIKISHLLNLNKSSLKLGILMTINKTPLGETGCLGIFIFEATTLCHRHSILGSQTCEGLHQL